MTGAVVYKPCPNGCGRNCDVRADTCRPCRNETVERECDLWAMSADSTRRPLLLDYETHCMACGRGAFVQYTREQVADLKLSLPPCGHCGGFMMLEQSFTGPGSPSLGQNGKDRQIAVTS